MSGLTLPEQATDRLYAALYAEIVPRVPAEMWDTLAEGGRIERDDRALGRIAASYERGEASREEVLAAANRLRATWRQALQTLNRATS